jgi:hypothetical protein
VFLLTLQTADARIHRSDWRKSSQWFGMLRKHVQTVLEDTAVFRSYVVPFLNQPA